MNQTSIFICCLIILGLSGIQGIPLSRMARCSCITISTGPIKAKSFKKLEIIPESQSCQRVEIIATMKNGEKRCLNPESKAIKNLLKTISKERSKRS
ncbi:C-X-C motif chemokine 10 [Thomomys bottae]